MHVYTKTDEVMFMLHGVKTAKNLLKQATEQYNNYNPEAHRAAEIAKLKRQLAKLEGGADE